jgi:hypothetical protein
MNEFVSNLIDVNNYVTEKLNKQFVSELESLTKPQSLLTKERLDTNVVILYICFQSYPSY